MRVVRFVIVLMLTDFVLAAADGTTAAPIDESPAIDENSQVAPAPQPQQRPRLDAGGNIWARDPRLQGPLLDQARRALKAGRFDECLSHLRAAAEENPAMPPPHLALAFLHLAEGQGDAALAALDKAAAVEKFHPEVYLTCGQLALLEGRRVDAQLHFEQALRLKKPEAWSAAHQHGFAVTCLSGLAAIAEARRDWAGLAQVLGKWGELEPDNAALLDRLGAALFLAGRTEEALEKFRASYQRDPSLSPPELSIAAMHTKVGQFEQADSWYRTAREKYPGDARVYFEQGSALLVMGKFEEARQQIDKALEVGEHLEALGTDVPLMRGFLARAQQDFAQAEAFFTEVLRQTPGQPQALNQLPLVLVEQEEETKRKRALQLALFQSKNEPASPQARATLAWVYHRLGRNDEALSVLKKGELPTDPESLFIAAQLLFEFGSPQDARPAVQLLEAALAQPGLFIQRAQAVQWLETAALAIK